MIIPDERALKNLSESPNVCISKLFLQPKNTVLSKKNARFKTIFPYADQNNRTYVFVI